jgi:hypothetical protein
MMWNASDIAIWDLAAMKLSISLFSYSWACGATCNLMH